MKGSRWGSTRVCVCVLGGRGATTGQPAAGGSLQDEEGGLFQIRWAQGVREAWPRVSEYLSPCVLTGTFTSNQGI